MTKHLEIALAPVESTALQSMGYDMGTGTLRVQLHNGKVYDYHDVSAEKYAAMMGSKSIGSFWNQKIKAMHGHTEIDPRARK